MTNEYVSTIVAPNLNKLENFRHAIQCSLLLRAAFLACKSASSSSLAFLAARWAACIATSDPGALAALLTNQTPSETSRGEKHHQRMEVVVVVLAVGVVLAARRCGWLATDWLGRAA